MTFRPLLTVIAVIASITRTPAAAADELDDVMRLRGQGQGAAAIAKADRFLAAQPKDAQMRFARASLLADLKRNAEATAAYSAQLARTPGRRLTVEGLAQARAR